MKKDFFPRKKKIGEATAPHCDSRILHMPGSCQFCDLHPEYHTARKMWGINFTGQYDEDKLPCPSEVDRVLEDIEQWGPNRASPS